MFRGFPYSPPPKDCPSCKGTGSSDASGTLYDCIDCNGTGIAGDPRFLFWFCIAWGIFILWLLWRWIRG